jgi:hypothetical protein
MTVELSTDVVAAERSTGRVRMLPHMTAGDPSAVAEPFRGTNRRRQWQRLSRGLYVPRVSAGSLAEVARARQLLLPENAAFMSLTAAELLG